MNNILGQDHRTFKGRVIPNQGFQPFWASHRTATGDEAVNMLRKSQVRRVGGGEVAQQLRLMEQIFD